MTEEIGLFVSKFFINLGARFVNREEMIIVDKIPVDFQGFIGKKEPYHFVFNEEALKLNPQAELISKGSTLLRLMSEYMGKKGQTTLLKIDFSKDTDITIPVILKEGELYKQERKNMVEYITRFTFSSSIQYLNEKEQILTQVDVKDGNIIELDLSNLEISEGFEKDISTYREVKDSYTIAKNSIRYKLRPKVESISLQLENKLEKEIERINKHYLQMDEEIKSNIDKLHSQLIEAEKEGDQKKTSRIKNDLEEKKKVLADKMREIERDFFIKDEINKHSLNLNTRLLNTTVIYYDNFIFKLYIRNGKVIRAVEMGYNPFSKLLSPIPCDSCKWPLKELILCNSGHISCPQCKVTKCDECKLAICKSCSKKECNICRKTLCKKCDSQCAVCLKTACISHRKKDSLSGKDICNECGRECCKCQKWFDNKKLRVFGPKKICEACFRIHSIGQ